MKDIAHLLMEGDTTVAVVGATDDPEKYGSVIYRDLKRKGFRVFPVNPNRSTVDNDATFPSLAALPEPPTIINIVVPEPQTLQVLAAAKELGLANVWVQPGAGGSTVIAYLDEHGFNYLANACIMVRSRHRTSA